MTEFVAAQSRVLISSKPGSVEQFMLGSYYPGSAAESGAQSSGTCAIGTAVACPSFALTIHSSQLLKEHRFNVSLTVADRYVSVSASAGASVTLDGATLVSAASTIGGWSIYRELVDGRAHRIIGVEPVGVHL